MVPKLHHDFEKQRFQHSGNFVRNNQNPTFDRKGSGSGLHCANTTNFFYNIHGKKHWLLIHPKYSPYLKPVISKNGVFAISKLNCFSSEDALIV